MVFKLIIPLVSISLLTACGGTGVEIDKQAADRGKEIATVCAACHALSGTKNGVGPSLAGIYGRNAASVKDYQYSAALSASKIKWNKEALMSFLIDPQASVPGTNMVNNDLDENKANDIVEYLKTL